MGSRKPDAVVKSDKRFADIMAGTITPGAGGGAKLDVYIKVLRNIAAERLGIKTGEVSRRLKDEDTILREVELHIAADCVNRGLHDTVSNALDDERVRDKAYDVFEKWNTRAHEIAEDTEESMVLELEVNTEVDHDPESTTNA
jgi:hypothetical protein